MLSLLQSLRKELLPRELEEISASLTSSRNFDDLERNVSNLPFTSIFNKIKYILIEPHNYSKKSLRDISRTVIDYSSMENNWNHWLCQLKFYHTRVIANDSVHIDVDRIPGFNPCNPSIYKTESGYIAIVRFVNYAIDERCGVTMLTSNWHIMTKNFIVYLDKNMRKISQLEVRAVNYTSLHSRWQGLEDIRIMYIRGDIIHSTCTIPDIVPGKIIIAYLTINLKTGEGRVSSLDLNKNPVEKNWLPFIHNDKPCVIYDYHPFTILTLPELDILSRREYPGITFNGFHGSAPPVKYGDNYLFIVHQKCANSSGAYEYYNRFVVFNGTDITRVSASFIISQKVTVEMIIGLCHSHTDGEFIITYGYMDREARYVVIRKDEIETLLNRGYVIENSNIKLYEKTHVDVAVEKIEERTEEKIEDRKEDPKEEKIEDRKEDPKEERTEEKIEDSKEDENRKIEDRKEDPKDNTDEDESIVIDYNVIFNRKVPIILPFSQIEKKSILLDTIETIRNTIKHAEFFVYNSTEENLNVDNITEIRSSFNTRSIFTLVSLISTINESTSEDYLILIKKFGKIDMFNIVEVFIPHLHPLWSSVTFIPERQNLVEYGDEQGDMTIIKINNVKGRNVIMNLNPWM